MQLDIDLILPSEEEKEDLERLAALGYSLREIALYFKWPFQSVKHDATTDGCVLKYHIDRGKLTVKANANMQLLISAENGNITAVQQLAKVVKEREYQDLLQQLEEEYDND